MSEVGGEQFLQSKCSHFVLSINLENRKKKSTNLYPAMLDSHLPSSHDDYVAFHHDFYTCLAKTQSSQHDCLFHELAA
jgi:hypothetical protein